MVDMTAATNPEHLLPPGFRFHPTDEELILHYLRNRASAIPCPVNIIAEVDIYKFDPWELPPKAVFGDREWYFFSPRDRKYPNGVRPNRAAGSGYWKATGTDKPILVSAAGAAAAGSSSAAPRKESVGVKKALVFYKGKPPRGSKTNWIMHEYRLPESPAAANGPAGARRLLEQHQQYFSGNANCKQAQMSSRDSSSSMRLDDWVLCRIYEKTNNNNTQQPQHSAGSTLEPERCLDGDLDVEESSDNYAPSPFGYQDTNTTPATSIQNHYQHHDVFYKSLPKAASLSDLLAETDTSVLSRFLYETPVPGQTDAAGGRLPELLSADPITRPLQPMVYQQLVDHALDAKTAASCTLTNKRQLPGLEKHPQSKKQRLVATTAATGLGSGQSAYLSVMNGCSSFSPSSACNLAAAGAGFAGGSTGAYTQLLTTASHPSQFTVMATSSDQNANVTYQPYILNRLHQQHMQMQLLNADTNGSLKLH